MNRFKAKNSSSTAINKQLMRQQLADHLEQIDWDVAATLTFRDDIDEKTARKILFKFWHRIDRHIYKNAASRNNKRVARVNFVEGDDYKRYHVHLLAKSPRSLSCQKFVMLLELFWAEMPHTGFQNEYIDKDDPRFDARGWTLYSSKSFSAYDTDAWDTASTHLAEPTENTNL